MSLFQGMVVVIILCWLGWHLAIPVDFIRSDLGRHIKNGELILQGNRDILYKNYYSYTNPQYPFINHHWLFGVCCYILWHYFGFSGLSFIYLLLELFTFYVFFRGAWKNSSFLLACAFALLSFPLITIRSEVRPEGVSYLFCGLFWWMIDSYRQNRITSKHLIIALCVLQVIWVNMHIFFIIGPILTAIFWWQESCNGEEHRAKTLQKLFFLLLGMCLINPSGIKGLLSFFYINKVYSYWVLETQSVFYLLKAAFMPWRSFALYFLFALSLLSMGLFFLVRREGFKKYIAVGSLTLVLSVAAIKAIRMIGLFGFFWIPLSAQIYHGLLQVKSGQFRKRIEMALLVSGIIVSAFINFDWNSRPSLGIYPGSNDAAEFFKREKIAGPVFNNFDDGGYLIFHLSPQYKFFIDDRIEAFPRNFFLKTYIPMQVKSDVWQKMEGKYHFNVIFFSIDTTPWAAAFMKDRLADPSWVVVYYSDKAMILLKRNAQNAGIIRRNEIKVVNVQA